MDMVYLLIGSGRVSLHFQNYFRLLGLPFHVWSRAQSQSELEQLVAHSSHVLCLISDGAIEEFISANSYLLSGKIVVQMSGALTTELAEGVHPLMSFPASQLYDLETYCQIPFVVEKTCRPFAEILPGLSNPHFTIEGSQKGLYHALCVLSGNFTTMLWQKAFTDFENRLGLPREILLPYLKQITRNLESDPENALTGPIARKDIKTIEKNLNELKDDPFLDVYRGFLRASDLGGLL